MYPIQTRDELLREIRVRLGGHGAATRLAQVRGVSIAAVSKWLREGIPPAEVGIISGLTGIPDYAIRPDQYLPPLEIATR